MVIRSICHRSGCEKIAILLFSFDDEDRSYPCCAEHGQVTIMHASRLDFPFHVYFLMERLFPALADPPASLAFSGPRD